MSKRKADETTTRKPRKEPEAPATEGNGTEPEAAAAPTKPKGRKAKGGAKEPRPELVVFALRMTAEERAALHKAAGPAKATKFARALLTAASRGDAKAVADIVAAVQTS